MEITKACNFLGIRKQDIYTLSEKQLKHKYHILALRYHPDKNKSPNANKQFQEIHEAYHAVCKEKQIKPQKMDYRTLLSNYLSYYVKDSEQIVELLYKKVNTNIDTIVENCSRRRLILIHSLLYQQKDLLHIPDEILTKVKDMIRRKTIEIELECSFKDMWEQKIYVLPIKDETLYIPLWHTKLEYNIQGYLLEITCKCSDRDIIIDRNNNVHITLSRDQYKDNHYKIPVLGLKKVVATNIKNNKIILQGEGLPKINHDDIYDNTNLGDVILSLC